MSKDTEYIDEAMELLRGVPAVEFQPSADVIVEDEHGELHHAKSPAWVKFSTAFRSVLPKLKGAPLSVFVSIGLHVNAGGKSWPSLTTICSETGYERAAVVRAIKKLKDLGVIKAMRRSGNSTIYTPVYVAYGRNSTPHQNRVGIKSEPVLGIKKIPVLGIKSELKEEPLEEEPRKKNHLPAAGADGKTLYDLAVEIANVCGMDFQANKGRLFREARLLEKASPPPTPQLIRESFSGSDSFWTSDWRGAKGQRPTPAVIREVWGQLQNYSAPAEYQTSRYDGYLQD